MGNKKVIGYDVKKDVQEVDVAEFDDFASRYQRLILVKPKDISEQQRSLFINFLRKRVGLPYNTILLHQSLWSRIVSTIKNKEDKDYKEVLEDLKQAFFCSNLISMGLFKSGWKGDFNKVTLLNVWPVDFLVSNDFEKIGQYKP